jgi:cystathionine beta-lyase/cystathionine gamma-synthase
MDRESTSAEAVRMDRYPGFTRTLLYGDDDPTESAIAPPIYQTVPFEADDAEDFLAMNSDPLPERAYRRYGNPTQTRLERIVAALEGAEVALATGSGIGAISTTMLTFLSAGDHVVAQRSMYGGTLGFLRTIAPRFGITTTLVDQTDTAAFARAVTDRTRLFALETPTNPQLDLTDLRSVAAVAREHGIVTMVDNTIATPVNQRPLALGIDLVVHSVTKALSGHSDVLAGVVAGRLDHVERIWDTHILSGSVVAPLDAWLAVRGLRTLTLRVAQQERLALAAARFLAEHDAVRVVNYPGLETHPQHDLARSQMDGFGSVLSFELHGGRDAAEQVLASLRLAARAPSLGGFRSLAVQPAAMWAAPLDEEELSDARVPEGLIRLSVGLEEEADLVADLDQALAKVQLSRV